MFWWEIKKQMKKKVLQCIIKDDKDEGKEISSKDKGKCVTSGSGSTHYYEPVAKKRS